MLSKLPEGLTCRFANPNDHPMIIGVLVDWWGGRDLTWMLPRLFLNHFAGTSFVVEKDEVLAAFLIGFLSPTRSDEGYIHFAGVHPDLRGKGIGAYLYCRFFELCREHGRETVRACTSPVNIGSVAFHRKIGFRLSKGNAQINGMPVTLDYNKPGDSKVLFEIMLSTQRPRIQRLDRALEPR